MQKTATILKFQPRTSKLVTTDKKKRIVNIDGVKYYTREQIRLLRRTVRDKAIAATEKGNLTGIREWLAIDILTSSGVRVSEAAGLRCGDIRAGYGESAIFIRNGKGCKCRTVQIPESLKRHLKAFVSWKVTLGEASGKDDYLFIGQRGPWSSQAIQQVVKKYLKMIDIYEPGKSVHSLRHSFAVELYRKERDLRTVQKQLGHESIQTTMIYVDVLREDVQRQMKGMWNGLE